LRISVSQCILEEYSISYLKVNMSKLQALVTQIRSHSEKILISSVFCSAVILSFIGGALYTRDQQEESRLVVNIPDYREALQTSANRAPEADMVGDTPSLEPISDPKSDSSNVDAKNCPYVGSKNSDKYHLASCGVVKRIKKENIRCFATPEMAEKAGYVPGCLQ
jgi:hypothetical protein